MSAVWDFLSRTQGGSYNGVKRLTLTDYLCYLYLAFGFLLIFLPVCWIALNSIKSDFQLEKQDISLLPTDYQRVGRGTVNGPKGREIFFIKDLPDWVLNWSDLRAEEKALHDPTGFIANSSGPEFYVLRSHLGLVASQTRQMITELNLPSWLTRYSSMAANAREALDVDAVMQQLDIEQQRLLKEYLGIKPYNANRLVSQVLVSAPDPATGETKLYG
nr:carbohydrate ABC transporter permease [Gammaproteobacteria bacterium]